MSRTILLARPHPFIVEEMRPFLEHSGYAVSKLDLAAADTDAVIRNSAGAVISLALVSSVNVSAEDVLMRLRKSAPDKPLLFAAMVALETLRNSLLRLAEQAGIQATLLNVSTEHERSPALGKPGTFLYVSRDDMADPKRRAMATLMVKRHFG